MARNVVVVGTQWGDEGKGKIVDWLTEQAQGVVRFQGGHNAGHTLVIDGRKTVLRLIPSGILHPGKVCVIGNGVVVDPIELLNEIRMIEGQGMVTAGRLWVSDRAHLAMSYHKALDKANEAKRGPDRKIGTTGRGIGPCYGDKVGRNGLRVGDMLAPQFSTLVAQRVNAANETLVALGAPTLDAAAECETYLTVARALTPYIADALTLAGAMAAR